jgi:hypothetical protein
VYPAVCALLSLTVCTLAEGLPPSPHDCSYYNAVPSCNSNFCCLKNEQLYGKALGTGFVGIMVPPNALGEQGSGSVGHKRGQRQKILKKKRERERNY